MNIKPTEIRILNWLIIVTATANLILAVMGAHMGIFFAIPMHLFAIAFSIAVLDL